MNIAIVGGGFYGCYIAKTIRQKLGNSINISIFDRSDKLLSRAATNNQCRLHLGFHYPRCAQTIRQTIEGFALFLSDFKSCIHFPKKNFYAVHTKGYVSFASYLAAMDTQGLDYEIVSVEQAPYFRQPHLIEGVIRVGEGVIELQGIVKILLSQLDAKCHLNTVVTSIDSEKGELVANEKRMGPYDLIINTTYTEPNLGLPPEKQYDLKYELAAMVMLDAPFEGEVALTIMDGPFVSLYPCGDGLATLSSVLHTPFLKCDSSFVLEEQLALANETAVRLNVLDNILTHGKEMLNLELSRDQVRGLWIAPKTKICNDEGDTRICMTRTHEKLISVLCGKLDAAHHVTDDVVAAISSAVY
jgi:hypothetical protein